MSIRKLSSVLILVTSSALWLGWTGPVMADDDLRDERGYFESGHLIVKFRSSLEESHVRRKLKRKSLRSEEHLGEGKLGHLHRVAVASGREVSAIENLLADPDVEYAELNRVVDGAGLPNDPSFSSEWHLASIQAPAAWDVTAGSPSIVIAVLDSGIDPSHPDLVPNLVAGFNFYDNNLDTSDVHGHGTAVAGAAVMAGNNSLGGTAVCQGCGLMPVRVAFAVNGVTHAYYSTVAQGMHWAADHGAKIQNISYGGIASSSTIQDAAKYVHDTGGLVFGSAGNEGIDPGLPQNPYLIMVGATDAANTKTSWSCFGSFLTLAAPGVNIFTTFMGGGYGFWQGTSLSSPIAAGVGALIWSANPGLSNDQVRNILITSSDDLGAVGWDPSFGYGKVNAANAVVAAKAVVTSGVGESIAPLGKPYSGVPAALPGLVQAEDYDLGGEGVAYHDTTLGNAGGSYRDEAVDIEPVSDTGGGYDVGWISSGEWLNYTVNVSKAGMYSVDLRVARPAGSGAAHIEVDGVDVTGPIAVPGTGGWQNWQTVTVSGVSLKAGPQVLKIVIDTGGLNLNWFQFR